MCAHWDVKLTTYNTRIESGRTVEVALTGEWERGFSHSKPCTDHLGNDFPSQRAMCEHWGVDPGKFSSRRASGKTVEEALTAVNAKCKPCTDHLGNDFPSQRAMCAHWGVDSTTFRYRLKHGKTLEQALTEERGNGNSKPCTDHLGQEFPSIVAMCKHWGVNPGTFNVRIKSGRSLEQALTEGGATLNLFVDHLGNEFPSIAAMCEHWGAKPGKVDACIKKGETLEQALTGKKGS